MNKKQLSEADICAKFITPAILAANWDEHTQLRREVHFTKGQIHVRGKMTAGGSRTSRTTSSTTSRTSLSRSSRRRTTTTLSVTGWGRHSGTAKSSTSLRLLLQRRWLRVPRPNGDAAGDRVHSLARRVPVPGTAVEHLPPSKGLTPEAEEVVLQDYFDDGSGREPAYYQRNAINRTTEAIAKGQNRVLLVMATGTGKTYTAFQIIWRLWKSGRKKRVLYLADRNVLIDQTMVNDFRPFKDAMTKLSTRTKTIETADGRTARSRPALTQRGGSTSRTRSTSACTKRSPGPRRGRSSISSSRPGSSTSSLSTSVTAGALTPMRHGERSSTTSPPPRRSA